MNDEVKVEKSDFDQLLGRLDGLPDVVRTKPSTIRDVPLLGVGAINLYVVQTFRQKERGDVLFLEHVGDRGQVTRLVIPPSVTKVIARQHDQLTKQSRSRAAKQRAEDDKAAGKVPGFMRQVK